MRRLIQWTFFILIGYFIYLKMIKPIFSTQEMYLYSEDKPLQSFSIIRQDKSLYFEKNDNKWILSQSNVNIPLDQNWVDSILTAFTKKTLTYQKTIDELDFKLYGLDESNTAILNIDFSKNATSVKNWAIGVPKEGSETSTWIRPIGSKDLFLIEAPLFRWFYTGLQGLVPEDKFSKKLINLQNIAFYEDNNFVNGANKGENGTWCNAISKPKILEEDWESYLETVRNFRLIQPTDFDTIITSAKQLRRIDFNFTPPIEKDNISVWGTKDNTDSCIISSSFRNNLFYKISNTTFEQVFWKPLKMK